MKAHPLTLSLGAAALALTASAAEAQGRSCGPRQAVVDRLAAAYGESRQSIGLAPSGQVVEVFASLETGTWTITVTTPEGLMCLVASGQAFETLTSTAAPNTDPAL